MTNADDILFAPVGQTTAVEVDHDRHPTTVQEWCRLLDAKLVEGDGPAIRVKLKQHVPGTYFRPFEAEQGLTGDTADYADISAAFASSEFGRWVRNSTFLWREGVTPALVVDVRKIRQTHRIERLESGQIVDADESSTPECDNRLSHPDNMYSVLIDVFADWLRGDLTFNR